MILGRFLNGGGWIEVTGLAFPIEFPDFVHVSSRKSGGRPGFTGQPPYGPYPLNRLSKKSQLFQSFQKNSQNLFSD
jgi:hypothetical protein